MTLTLYVWSNVEDFFSNIRLVTSSEAIDYLQCWDKSSQKLLGLDLERHADAHFVYRTLIYT